MFITKLFRDLETFLKCQKECCLNENLGNSINGSNLKDPIQAEITRLKLLDDENDVNDVTLKINDVTLNNEFTIENNNKFLIEELLKKYNKM